MRTIKPPTDSDYDVALFDRERRFLYVKFLASEDFPVPTRDKTWPLLLRKLPDFLCTVSGKDCATVQVPIVKFLEYLVKKERGQ